MRIAVSGSVGMARHIDLSDKSTQKDGRNAAVRRHWFINPDQHEGLAAYRIELPEAGTVAAAHFHMQDQFQVFVHGPGSRVGRDPVEPYTVHYADACSPYGPIVCGPEGVAFFVFRLQRDPGAFVMPESRALMKKKPGRNIAASMPADDVTIPAGGIQALIGPHEDGLAIYRLAAPPHGRVTAPDPRSGGGQYVFLTSGSVQQSGEALPVRSCLFASPDDAALEIVAGGEGFNALLLQFPRSSWADRLAGTC